MTTVRVRTFKWISSAIIFDLDKLSISQSRVGNESSYRRVTGTERSPTTRKLTTETIKGEDLSKLERSYCAQFVSNKVKYSVNKNVNKTVLT